MTAQAEISFPGHAVTEGMSGPFICSFVQSFSWYNPIFEERDKKMYRYNKPIKKKNACMVLTYIIVLNSATFHAENIISFKGKDWVERITNWF